MRNTPLKGLLQKTPLKHGTYKAFKKGTWGHNPDKMSAKHEDWHLKQSEKPKDPKK
jgi:hypothetical protein